MGREKNLLANERGQREKERERELLTKSFMLHLVSYKINTRTAHSYFSKHTKAIGSTDFTIHNGFLSQITIASLNSQYQRHRMGGKLSSKSLPGFLSQITGTLSPLRSNNTQNHHHIIAMPGTYPEPREL